MGVLAGWAYRKAIVINATIDGTQTNYQMKVTLVKGAGVDVPGTIYLNSHCLNWPTDILFTLSDGTTTVGADFWLEESDGIDGSFWLEANSIPAGSTFNGYIYYGKAGASAASNGANTFPILFDHFAALSGWTAGPSQNYGLATVDGKDCVRWESGGSWPFSLLKDISLSSNIKLISALICTTDGYTGGLHIRYADVNNFVEANISTFDTIGVQGRVGGAWPHFGGATAKAVTNNVWYPCEYSLGGSSDYIFKVGAQSYSVTHADLVTKTKVGLSPSGVNYWYWDYIAVAKFTTNEPTWGNTGAEEPLGGGSTPVRNKFLSYRREHIKKMVFKRLTLK